MRLYQGSGSISSLLERRRLYSQSKISNSQLQMDSMMSNFSHEAGNWQNLAAMAVGGLTFHFARVASLEALPLSSRFFQTLPRLTQGLSSTFALACEVTSFRASSNLFLGISGHSITSEQSVFHSQGWASSFIDFALLKGSGRLAHGVNPILAHGLQDVAMVSGHNLGYALGFTLRPEGTLLDQLVHAEITNLQMEAGMALAGHLTGFRVQIYEKNLDVRLELLQSRLQPLSVVSGHIQIEMASEVQAKPFDLTPYQEILEHGIRNEADLDLARQLYKAVDPEGAGKLVDLSSSIPHTFKKYTRSNVGGSTFGSTTLTFSQDINRRDRTTAKEISLAILEGGEGIPLHVPPHEWKHATELTTEEKAELPEINLEGTLSQVYQNILRSSHWDEAFSFSTEPRFAIQFERVTGKDLFSFGIHQSWKEDHTELRRIYEKDGREGVFRWVSRSRAYLPYKVAALYMAILVKQGMRNFLPWDHILKSIGAEQKDGNWVIGTNALKNFYNTYLKSYLETHARDAFLTSMGLSAGKHAVLLGKTLRYFAGEMGPLEAADFLDREFDQIVEPLGALAFKDPMDVASKNSETMSSVEEIDRLPVLDSKPMKDEDPSERNDYPEKLADKIEIAGRFVKTLREISDVSDASMIENWESYLTYAEQADPTSAANVYSRMRALIRQRNFEASKEKQAFALRWSLGLSLLRSTYHELGLTYCREAIQLMTDIQTAKLSMKRSNAKRPDFREIIRLGHPEVIEEYFDQFILVCESEFTKFEREAGNPPDNLRVDYGVYTTLLPLISELTREIKEADIASYPASLNLKVHQLIERIWQPLRVGMEAKIEKYRQRYAADRPSFNSLDELTVLHPPKEYSDDDSVLLVGNRYSRGTDSSPVLIDRCLRSPLTYEIGLRLLAEFPQSQEKLELYKLAREYMPDRLEDAIREELAESYWKVLFAQEEALIAWKMIEDKSYKNTKNLNERNALVIDSNAANKSHLFWEHMTGVARIYAASKNPDHHEKARKILRHELSEETVLTPNLFSDALFHDHFQAALWKAKTLAEEVTAFPREEREEVLREALALTWKCKSEGLLANHKGRVILSIAHAAARENLPELLEEIHRAWNEEIVPELNVAHANCPEIMKESVQKHWKEVKNRANTLFPFWGSLIGRGKNFEAFLQRVEEDARTGRRIFMDEALTQSLWFLTLEEVAERFTEAERENLFSRFSTAVIQHQIQSAGQENLSISYVWAPVVKAIRKLSISPRAKDNILHDLVEAITPEAGSSGSGKNAPIERVADGYQLVEFAIGNPETPKTEGILLNRFAANLRDLDFSRSDPRAAGALRGIAWIFERVADRGMVDPAHHDANAQLRTTPYYQEAQKSLDLFQSPRLWRKIEISDADRAHYQNVLETGDRETLEAASDRIATAIAHEFVTFIDTRENREDKPPIILEMQALLLAKAYQAWKQAITTGDSTRAELLFPLWTHASDAGDALHKRRLYYEVMDGEEFPIESKRAVFAILVKNRLVRPYEKYVWEHPLIVGNPYREPLFYSALVPPIRHDGTIESKGSETHYVYLLRPITELSFIKHYYARARRLRKMHSEGYEWKMNPLDPCDRELYTLWGQDHWAKAQAGLHAAMTYRAEFPEAAEIMFQAVKALSEFNFRSDKPLGTSLLKDAHRGLLEEKLRDAHISIPENLEYHIARLFWLCESLPEAEQARDSLTSIRDIRYEKDLRSDEVQAALFEMPEVFKKRDSLTQFLLSRFFMEMEIGEQHTLRKSLKGINEEQALRLVLEKMGLEKIGQFLSFWPEVPPPLRKELSHLQNEVEPSDFEEVKETIRTQLGPGPETDALIRNMDEMLARGEKVLLGSGSIGEAYRSRLSTGEEVVIKVITPSKERKFKTALRRIEKIHYLLWLHRKKWASMPGAREAFRLIDMYRKMVKKEFDLRVEKQNADALREDLPEGIAIPRYMDEFSREKVVVQTFARGVKLEEIEDPATRERILSRIRNHLLQNQVLQKRKYHSDLQPGNIRVELVGDTERVWLLDFGQVGDLEESEATLMTQAWTCFSTRSFDELPSILEKMSEDFGSYDQVGLRTDLQQINDSWNGDMNSLSPLISKIFKACQERGLLIELSYLQLLKGFATFEATANPT